MRIVGRWDVDSVAKQVVVVVSFMLGIMQPMWELQFEGVLLRGALMYFVADLVPSSCVETFKCFVFGLTPKEILRITLAIGMGFVPQKRPEVTMMVQCLVVT